MASAVTVNRALADGQVGACIVQRIVARGRERALRDAVGADIAGCCRRRRQRTRQAIAIDQARATDLIGQRRIGIAIGPALGIGRHRERALADREVVACIVQRVVARGRQRSLPDAVGADIAGCCRRRRQSTRQAVAIDQARAADLIGQRRIGIAIGSALGIGRHRERALADGEVVACIVQRVIARGRQRALRDAVGADIAGSCRRRRQRTRQRIAVGQARAADLIGQRRIGIAIGAALRIGRHRDRALADGQVGARIVQRVVAGGRQRALRNAVGADIAGRCRRRRQRTRQAYRH